MMEKSRRFSFAFLRDRAKEHIGHRLTHPSFHSAKVWVVMGLVSLALIWVGQSLGDRFGLLIGFLLALGLNALIFFYNDMRLVALFPGTELEGHDPWGLLRTTRELSARIGVRRPKIQLIESPTPVAFSTGILPKNTTLFVSTELVRRLTLEETRAVLAYELQRLKSHQTSAATAISALAGLLTLTAGTLDFILGLRFLPFMQRRTARVGTWLGPAMLAVSPLVALLVRMTVSRRSILQVDRSTAELMGDSETLARALLKLDAYSKTRPLTINIAEAHLFTVSPLARYPGLRYLWAQPPIETRLRALTGRFPL